MGSPVTTRSRFPRPSASESSCTRTRCFCRAVCFGSDSVQTLGAGVLVPVLARPASPVVQVPNETAAT